MAELIIKKNKKTKTGTHILDRVGVADWVIAAILFVLCLTCILPFIHIAAKSISSNTEVLARKIYLLPKGINFDAYMSIIRDGGMIYSIIYSVVVTLIFTFLGMVVCICTAYPLSKRRLKGRKFFSFYFMFPMYFSAGLIPQYLLYQRLNLLNTMWVLILPLIYSAYNMLIMRTYFQNNLPDSLEESAVLDGATNFQILFKIALPLSKPILATLSLFYAVGRWNSYADNMYFIKAEKLKMIQFKLFQMVSSATEAQSASLSEAAVVQSTPEVLQAAAIMFVTIPIILVYPFLQKYFVKGVMIGAVKG